MDHTELVYNNTIYKDGDEDSDLYAEIIIKCIKVDKELPVIL